MNKQPAEHQVSDPNGLIDLHSIFYTIQGEGPYVGRPAVFIRLAGCNLQCPMCDTDYTNSRRHIGIDKLISEIKTLKSWERGQLVVITGGEPFRQQSLGNLVSALIGNDYIVQIETNGTFYVPGPWYSTTIVCSPKTLKLESRLLPYINAFKYIVDSDGVDKDDGLPVWVMGYGPRHIVARPPFRFGGTIYLQPLDEKNDLQNEENLQVAVRSCLRFGYSLSLQLHKIAGLD